MRRLIFEMQAWLYAKLVTKFRYPQTLGYKVGEKELRCSNLVDCCLYTLVKQKDGEQPAHFYIVLGDFRSRIILRHIYDQDEEYAENCANEMFDYLTEEI